MEIDIPPLVDHYLRLWAQWMHAPGNRLGYPRQSAGLRCGGVSGEDAFDLLCEEADGIAARAMGGIIESLEPDESAAIHHHYLHAVYRLRDMPGALERATTRVWRMMLARGLA